MSQIQFLEKGFSEGDVNAFFNSPGREFFWEFLKLFRGKGTVTLDELKKFHKKINCDSHLNYIIFQLTEMGMIFKSDERVISSSPGAPFNITPVYSLTSLGESFMENYL
ncbi:MAG: hypothetical protein ACOCUF_03995 [Patescibacteria group bacterium]